VGLFLIGNDWPLSNTDSADPGLGKCADLDYINNHAGDGSKRSVDARDTQAGSNDTAVVNTEAPFNQFSPSHEMLGVLSDANKYRLNTRGTAVVERRTFGSIRRALFRA